MDRQLILTGDGSHSFSVPELNVGYRSIHGAIQESRHIFIEAGFYGFGFFPQPGPYKIFELGFGTGLNALLTLMEAEKIHAQIRYETIEPFPLNEQEVKALNYCHLLNRAELQNIFEQMHSCEWEGEVAITENFFLTKKKTPFFDFTTRQHFKLIYFDAFAPDAQPELWTKEVFDKVYSLLDPGGILVTYSSKGDVRRAIIAAGFEVEKLPGPPHKREIIRAKKYHN